MGRPPSSDKSNVKRRRRWTAEEDAKLLAYVSTHGTANWDSVPEKAGLNRCGNSCRRRWLNHLMPDLKHGKFTPQEEEKIINLHATMGNKWSMIASQLPGRTDTNVKNYWNTKLSKKLLAEGIDPVTHRPISDVIQITGSLPTTTTASTSDTAQCHSPHGTRTCNNLSQALKNIYAFLSKSTPIIHPTFPERKPPSISSNLFPQPCDVSTVTRAQVEEASSSTTVAAPPTLPELKWSDFLIEDVFLPDDEGESEPKSMEGSATVDQNGLADEWWGAMEGNVQGSSYDGSSSFVDAILDRHQETVFQFPEFLDDDIL